MVTKESWGGDKDRTPKQVHHQSPSRVHIYHDYQSQHAYNIIEVTAQLTTPEATLAPHSVHLGMQL